ncbi:hydrogenase maturation protease [Ralstonia chuxiongensis]|uniref:hydrogenase maturation protease n=1 Tax=Ralstonia chuxiongensis TaxID=2957504 RepID=UPI0028F54559|nr:hydrogenase maturation protease [Ralstonia chuxiongensis]CAJ0780197.1 hypothetical protein R8510_04712 [Ralstonia chuxiongensis]
MTPASDPSKPVRRVLVIGIGNPDRGDDGVGPLVTMQLAGRLPPEVAIVARHGDMLALIDDWIGIDAVVCIDACAPDGQAGRVRRFDLTADDLPRDVAPVSGHALGLGEAVALARRLGCMPEQMVVYAIEGACFNVGAPMSYAVTDAARLVADQVIDEVRSLQHVLAEGTSNA